MCDVSRLCIETSCRQLLEVAGFGFIAVTSVPCTGENRYFARIRVGVGGHLKPGRKFKANCIRSWLAGVANKSCLLQARQRQTALRTPFHFRWSQCHDVEFVAVCRSCRE